jgi:hypothetical protein
VRRTVRVIIPVALLAATSLGGAGLAQAATHPLDTLKVCTEGALNVGDNDMAVSATGHVMFHATNNGADTTRVAVFTPQSPDEGGSVWVTGSGQNDWHFHTTAGEPVQWKFSVSVLVTNHNPTDAKYQILSENCF